MRVQRVNSVVLPRTEQTEPGEIPRLRVQASAPQGRTRLARGRLLGWAIGVRLPVRKRTGLPASHLGGDVLGAAFLSHLFVRGQRLTWAPANRRF
jgi:hypothetical protein